MSSSDLANFIESISGENRLAIEENLGDGFVRLRTEEAERRQAKHDIRSVEDIVIELLRNSRDAHAHTIYLSVLRDGDTKILTVLDDGDGVPDSLQSTIFEPRVTSKLQSMVMDKWGVHGRGMALYSIKSNTSSARVVTSDVDAGCSIQVEVDLNALPEKKDQSTYPTLSRDEDGALCIGKGPHNVIRVLVEFALEHRESATVYLGSPTEIMATMYHNARKQLSDEQILFCDDIDSLPVCLRPGAASDANELMELAERMGLPISERTAHRIIAGQIPLPKPPLRKLVKDPSEKKPAEADIYKDSRGLKVSQEDLSTFSRSMESAFQYLAERYFLQLNEEPKIKVGKDSITVKFNIDKEL